MNILVEIRQWLRKRDQLKRLIARAEERSRRRAMAVAVQYEDMSRGDAVREESLVLYEQADDLVLRLLRRSEGEFVEQGS